MKVEQIFYGRSDAGYGILGASVPRCGLTDSVQDVCESIGTPGAEYADDDKPILIQRRIGDTVVMICGRAGSSDSLGRATLFFHALAADAADLAGRKLSAFDFFKRDLFAEGYSGGKVLPLEIDIKGADLPAAMHPVNRPAVVRCRRADSLNLAEMLGPDAPSVNWATFSWRPLKDFDFYGLDLATGVARLPANVHVYDMSGEEMRRTLAEHQDSVREPAERKRGAFGILPAIVGALLGCCLGWCVGALSCGEHAAAAIAEDDRAAVPVPTFPDGHRIVDFDARINGMPSLVRETLKGKYGSFLGDLREYVNFVNTNAVFKAKEVFP